MQERAQVASFSQHLAHNSRRQTAASLQRRELVLHIALLHRSRFNTQLVRTAYLTVSNNNSLITSRTKGASKGAAVTEASLD